MIDVQKYIEQGLRVVDKLIAEQQLQSALAACNELLKVNPYHRTVHRYLSKIESLIIKDNERRVDKDIAATAHLWDEGRYDELIQIYTRLYQYAPQYAKLQHLIEKLNSRLSKDQQEKRAGVIDEALEQISGFLKNQEFGKAIQGCGELLAIDPSNSSAKSILANAKEALIKAKLKENERLTDSADFERAVELYQSLLAINPYDKGVKRLLERAREHIAEQKRIEEKIHLHESITRMKELFGRGEYEKVLQACEEIDRLDPGNFTARLLRKKALRSIDKEIEKAFDEKCITEYAALKDLYQKNPTGFVKV